MPFGGDYRACPDAVPPVEFNVGGAMQGVFIPLVFFIGDVTATGTGVLVDGAIAVMGGTMGRER